MLSRLQKHTIIAVSVSIILTGCGGGGGGGGGGTSAILSPFVRTTVPYHTPERAGTFQPFAGSGVTYPVADIFVKDLNNDSVDEVVIGGRKSGTAANWQNYNMQVYGWNSGAFRSETTTWFAGTDNVIQGTEPSIKFGDFNGDGRVDMFVAAGSDGALSNMPSAVFLNQGNRFVRSNLDFGNVWTHDSAVTDLNGDGYADIIITDYNMKPAVAFGSAAGTFNIVKATTTQSGASGISVADYLGNGTKTLIMTDAGGTPGSRSDTHLFSWSTTSGSLVLTQIADLPESRFYLPKWDSARAAANIAPHEIRNITMDFNRDGRPDVIVFSTLPKNGNVHGYSEVQFLRNNGGGSFTDVTDSVLRDYNTNRSTSYQPILIDVNNDGLMDILLSANDYTSQASTTVLINTQEGIFVEKYTSVFSDLTKQIISMTPNAVGGTPIINIVNGPNNVKYLVSSVSFDNSGTTNTAVYLAKIGSFGTVTAPISIAALQNTWPWMSGAQANESLARTASSFVQGVPVLDIDAALRPIDGLWISLDGRTGQRRSIVGSIMVPGMDRTMLNNITAVDGLGRNFQINASVLAAEPRPMPIRYSQVEEPATAWGSRFIGTGFEQYNGFTAAGDAMNWTTGFNTHRLGFNSPYTMTLNATQMQGSPWMAFSGMFGNIRTSTVLDVSVTRTWKNNFWAQVGGMQTSTSIDAGLVSRVDPIYSMYAVGGYQDKGWSVYGGMQPTILAGSLTMRLPEYVDQQGVLHYNERKVSLQTRPVMFAGVEKKWRWQKKSMLSLSAVANTVNQYHTQVRYQYQF